MKNNKKKVSSKSDKHSRPVTKQKPGKTSVADRSKNEVTNPGYFIVTFREGKESSVQTVKTKTIQSSYLGPNFIALKDFLFETDSPVVHSQDESLALRFEDISIFHLSVYAIFSIEERDSGSPYMLNKKLVQSAKLVLED